MQNQYLEDLLHEVNLITKKVQAEFGRLNVEQLNWKPSSDQWSIAQCLDHLIKTNQQYFPLLEGIANGTRKKSFWESLPGLPGFFGKMMLKALNPSNQKKLKAPASFRPAASQLPSTIVSDFVEHQQQLARMIRATDLVDHQKTIVSSPVSGLITFSLKDGVSIMVVHEERHFMQAKRLLKAAGFPQPAGQAPNPTDPPRPIQPRPHQPRPHQPRSDQPRPNQSRPNQPKPDQLRPDQSKPKQARPDQSRPDRPKQNQSRPDQSKPKQARPDQLKPNQPRPDQAGPNQAKPDQPGPDQPRSNRRRPNRPRPNQPRSGQPRLPQQPDRPTQQSQ